MQKQLNINDGWVIDSFRECVRLNVRGGTELAQRLCTEPVVEGMGNILLDTELVNQLMHPQITNVRNKNLSIPEQIYNITTNSRFRRGNYNLIAEYENIFLEHIAYRVSSQCPIRITVPTLPFKDQNPLSTQRQVDQVDLGEFLFFRQMGDLCESVNRIYQPGMIIDLVSDGSLYQNMFLDSSMNTTQQVRAYYVNSNSAIESLGLNDMLKLHNLESIVEGNDEFTYNRNLIVDILDNLADRGVLENEMNELSLGMIFNSRSFVEAGECTNPVDFAYSFQTEWQNNSSEILKRFRPNALAYSSFLLTMKSLNILGNYFPYNLRGTVHPKKAPQIPLHTVNKNSLVAPYNGVPVVSRRRLEKTGDLRNSTRIMRYGELILGADSISCIEFAGDTSFAYMIPGHN